MDRLIYTAMTGASAAAQQQAILANNLANASTAGFKAELGAHRAVPVRGDGLASRVMAAQTTTGHLETAGAAQATGRALDVMPQGKAWLAVQALDGNEAYTRAGSLQIAPDGNLVTATGLQVLTDGGGPIAIPQGAQVSIGEDGTVTTNVPGQPPANAGRLKLAVATPEQTLVRGGDGLFRVQGGDTLASDPQARLASGTLESSNVDAVQTMVAMMHVTRHFEVQMRLLQGAEANDKQAVQLLSISG